MSEPTDIESLASEVANSNFDDERLNRRLKKVVEGLAEDPELSLPQLFDSAGLEGAYRFFSNPLVTPEEILAPHVAATRERCADEESFLVLHDSTSFSYRYDGEREGLGRAQRSNPRSNQMFQAHVSLVVETGSRRPLGVAALRTWVRGPTRSGVEYRRWEDQLRLSSEQLNGLGRAIHVMDREADDYEMFAALVRDGHRFVARCLHDRLLDEPGTTKLRSAFAHIEGAVQRQASVARRKPPRTEILRKIHPARDARAVNLSVAGMPVTLKRPKTRREYRSDPPPSLTLNVVRVWEANPPEGAEPIEWFLYTTDPIDTAEQQLEVVDHYRARWTIEEYFKALKTGCAFESRQLQDYEGLINLLATFAPIAYRLLLIRSEARRTPDESAVAVLSRDHIAVLRARGRSKLSENPTIREIYLAVAVLGGHIKYSKRDPGWLTLARGFEHLEKLTEGWLLAKLQQRSDQR